MADKTVAELLAEIRKRRNDPATEVGVLWNDIDNLLDAIEWQRDWFIAWSESPVNEKIYDNQLAKKLAGKGGA